MKQFLFTALATLTVAFGCSVPVIGYVGNDAGPDAQPTFDGAPAPIDAGVDSGLTCALDLHEVVDSSGNVVATCPADQGCAGGVCVPACNAAAAVQGSPGCDFVASTPAPTPSTYIRQPCFAMFVVNNWGKDAPVHVSRGTTVFDPSQFGRIAENGTAETTWAPIPKAGIPPGKVGVLFLSDDPASSFGEPLTCPIKPAVRQDYGTTIAVTNYTDSVFLVGRGLGFHVTTDLPVTSYTMGEYADAFGMDGYSSATLVYPTPSWGTNYFGFVPNPGNEVPTLQVVAAEDNTVVSLLPNLNLQAGLNVNAAPANKVATYVLNAGEYIQWEPLASGDMSGTIIQSSARVSVLSGSASFYPPSATFPIPVVSPDHKQLPPISAWASEYAIAPYATRSVDLTQESINYRIQAAVDGTSFTFDPPIAGAPTTLDSGQVANFESTKPFVVKSQDEKHPFYVVQIMAGYSGWDDGTLPFHESRPGCNPAAVVINGFCSLGNTEVVPVLPPLQFMNQYVFFTNPEFATTNLVFTRKKVGSAFEDVTLDCAGVIGGWTPIGTSGTYETTNVDLVRGTIPNGSCNAGPHTASSKAPFGVVVWGLDFSNSYAYPAGGNSLTINPVIVPPQPK